MPKTTNMTMTAAELLKAYAKGERNFKGVDLSGANLEDAELSEADFSGADFSGANLSYADLRYANFSEAILVGTDLSYADTNGAIGI